MREMQIRAPDQGDREYYSEVLTTIECTTKNRLTESHEAGEQAIQELEKFITELQFSADHLKKQYRKIHGIPFVRSPSPSVLAEEYLEPRLFPDEPPDESPDELCDEFIHQDRQGVSSTSSPFPPETRISSPSELPDEYQTVFPAAIINPRLLSNLPSTSPGHSTVVTRAGSPMFAPRCSERRICLRNLPYKHGPRVLSLVNTKMNFGVSSTSSSQKKRKQRTRNYTKVAALSKPSPELHPVVKLLIRGVGNILSLKQLQESLQALRDQLIASNMCLPNSTKEIWQRLDLLECNTHTNNIIHRICLLQLNSRRKDLLSGIKSNGTKVGTLVIDRIAQDAEEKDRVKVVNRLHAGTIWSTIADEYSIGILALFPTLKAVWPSNTAVEKLNQTALHGFLNAAKNGRHDFIERAAQKVTQIIPLFEGKVCKTVLKLEQVGVDELHDMQDETTLTQFLDYF